MRGAVEHPDGFSGKLVIANFTLGADRKKRLPAIQMNFAIAIALLLLCSLLTLVQVLQPFVFGFLTAIQLVVVG